MICKAINARNNNYFSSTLKAPKTKFLITPPLLEETRSKKARKASQFSKR